MTQLPPNWASARLDAVAEVRLGRQRSPKNHSGTQMRPYLRAANVGWDGLKLDDVKQMNFTDEEMSTYRLEPNDIVLSEASGSPSEVGKPALWQGEISDCAFQNTLIRVRTHGPEPRYLLHWFRHLAVSGAFASQSRGVGIRHIGRAKLADWIVPLPPLDEQRRIVDLLEDHLSRLDAGHRAIADVLGRMAELTRSILLESTLGRWKQDPITPNSVIPSLRDLANVEWAAAEPPPVSLPKNWRWVKWRDVGRSQNGRAFPSSDYSPSGVRLLRPGNLSGDGALKWAPENTRHLPETYRNSHADLLLNPGDIVMNLTAQSLRDEFLGRACLVGHGDDCLLNQRLARLVPQAVSPQFALLVFRSPMFRAYVSSLNSGSLIQHMFTKQLAEFWFPVPPPEDQDEAAARADRLLEACDSLRNTLRLAEARGEGLHQALLETAFAGRLTGTTVPRSGMEGLVHV